MKTWTTQAEQRLAEYLENRARREGFSGMEAEELKGDLRCHIMEEAERDDSETVNVVVLEKLLGRLDAGHHSPTTPIRETEGRFAGLRSLSAWTFGVVFPVGILIFEWFSHFCGSVFFDPVPTLWHAGLVLVMAFANAWILKGGYSFKAGIAGGVGLSVALFYAWLFLPLVPLSGIALLAMGMGMLSLAPIFAGLATWRITRHTAKAVPEFSRGRWWGIAAGALALILLEGPSFWTRANLEAAASESGSPGAVARLRAFHSERVLIGACYEGNSRAVATDISGWLARGWAVGFSIFGVEDDAFISDDKAARMREVYFRVTGKPVDSVELPPSARKAMSRNGGPDWNEFEFDPNLGSDQVALRLKGLDLADSRFDGHLDSASQLGYGEWTMVFSNHSPQAKEARCQVRLPQDGRISRLTLWVNGEPREAAFSTVAKVKEAYRSVAVVQRRDPVLVTMCGPDTVMVQCFPVPANGQMKIRLGITAPLNGGRWALPRIVERNFGWKNDLKQAVWLQGDKPFELKSPSQPAHTCHPDGPGQSLTVDLAANDTACQLVEMAGLDTPPAPVWCADPFAKDDGKFLLREAKLKPGKITAAPVIVIDASAPMAVTKSWLPEALQKVAGSSTILLADDEARTITPADLKGYSFKGGRNNEPALREAVRLAKERPGTAIVWIHGPQAVKLAQPEALLQLLERGTIHPSIHSLDVAPGPNRLGEALYPSGAMVQGPVLLDPLKDLMGFLGNLQSPSSIEWEWNRSSTSTGLPGREVWDHLAREWAARQTDSGAAEAGLAARYHLVTLTSGAVVLETDAQYAASGLEPGNPQVSPHIPTVPEPSAFLLIVAGGACLLLRRNRAKG
ncbi:MAG: VIT domain-containing protein [Luteolibacter sp.]